MTTIPLPYPTPPLNSNQRMHWAKKAKLVAQLRADARRLAKHHGVPSMPAAIVTLHYRPRARRIRDRLNLHPTLKPLVDGLIDAGMCPDDSDEYVREEIEVHAPTGEPAALWLTIEERP